MIGVAAGALVAAGVTFAPAFGAPGEAPARQIKRISAARAGIGSFTPASADPRLAAALARGGLTATGFRFTPAESNSKRQEVTVAVRARSATRSGEGTRVASVAGAAAPAVTLQPIAYNLGMSVGWKRFALTGDVARLDLAGMPGSRETVDVGVSYAGRRMSGRVQAGADRPTANTPALIADVPSYSIDVGTSYSLTRNLDVTAGVRYRTEQERARLPQLTDNRRDSQAVYVGTAFRF
ncbi:hypothetical protein [Sphingomonas baiyangensis]|uniref:Porin n=1 Tax=Sphingomonas baiyangensis TaxID=2572576 RepID=A0A4U1L4W7_9SPHN|nr:hypothetical protein [Sphingomonas baiyangensis]TKD51939.1 hypothetical protein FBR43_15205 [Sphingomonas baiyangensis]